MLKSSTLKLEKAIIKTMAFLFFFNGQLSAEPSTEETGKQAIDLYFALGDKHGFPSADRKTNFNCTDKIYAALSLANFEKKRYTVSFTWVDPNGEERERTEYPFTVTESTTKLWSWLSLSRARGAGMIQWINPAAGLEEFIGPWQVEIRVNNKKLVTEKVEITC